jgi:hypothetical protein
MSLATEADREEKKVSLATIIEMEKTLIEEARHESSLHRVPPQKHAGATQQR